MRFDKTSKQVGQLRVGRSLVAYRVYSSGRDRPILICINGAQQTMAAWASFVRYFSPYFSIVVFDFPGQGRSRTMVGHPSMTLDEQVELLHQIASEVGGGQSVCVFSASWGGIVAAAYAARYPRNVERLLLASFGLRVNSKLADLIDLGIRLIERGNKQEIGVQIVENFGRMLPGEFKQKVLSQFESMGPDKLESFYRHLVFCREISDLREAIPFEAIRAQTTIMNGEDDPIIDPQDALLAAERIPDCQAVVVPRAGHFMHFEDPTLLDRYAQCLLKTGHITVCHEKEAAATTARTAS